MVDEPAEIFDDMYLGLRAGAAARRSPPRSKRRLAGGSAWRPGARQSPSAGLPSEPSGLGSPPAALFSAAGAHAAPAKPAEPGLAFFHFLGGEEDRGHVLVGGIAVTDDDVHECREDSREGDSQEHGETTEEDPDRGDGDEHRQRSEPDRVAEHARDDDVVLE